MRKILQIFLISLSIISSLSFGLNDAKHHIMKNFKLARDVIRRNIRNENAMKHANTESQTLSKAGGETESGSGSSSMSLGESQAYSKTKVKTKISASSNAKSNSSAAAKAKAFAKTNSETKVKTSQGNQESNNKTPKPPAILSTTEVVPYPPKKVKTTTPTPLTRPTHAYWSPSFGSTAPPSPESSNSSKIIISNVTAAPSGETKIICVSCPVPCPYPIPCPCSCPVVPQSPTVVYCPSPCTQYYPAYPTPAPPTIIQVVPQPAVYAPCPNVDQPCYNPPSNCDCIGDINCLCKRNIVEQSTNDTSVMQGISQADIYSSHNFTYKHGAVAADNYKCSEMGKNILKKGGSAMDAAITTHLCVEIVNCHSTGLGGGGFLVAYDKNKNNAFTIDFREQLPYEFNNNKNSMTQGDTILVPGVLKGLELGHKMMGRLPWKELFEEPIKLAQEGFILHEALATSIAKKKDYIMANLGLREVFAPEGYLLTLGQRVKRTQLAETYKKIAQSGGSDILYKGEFAMDIVNDVQEAGGKMTLEDLKKYEAHVRKPLITKIHDMNLYGISPPASSATVAMMLKIMEKFKWTKDTLKNKPGLFYHQMVEAMKFAYAPSTFLGDPEYIKDTDKIVKKMLDDENIEKIFKKIDLKSHPVEYYGPFSKNERESSGTSHMSVVGPDGDAVSITSSINAHFGSKILSRRLGFIYNNELSDFVEFWPKVYNYSKDARLPGKRPMSKVSPMIMTNKAGEVKIVIGAAGGFFIPTALASTLSFYLFLHDNITTAISRPRIHCQLFPPTVVVEPTFPDIIRPLLNQYSHQYVTNDTYSTSGQPHAIMGVVQAIVRHSNGDLEGACDYRKGGLPSGF